MAKTPPYDLDYAVWIRGHLDAIESKFHSIIEDAIKDQLQFQPTLETRNRKRLKLAEPYGAEWELRCGPTNRFRIFYKANESDRRVLILAIALKVRNRVLIAGEEVTT